MLSDGQFHFLVSKRKRRLFVAWTRVGSGAPANSLIALEPLAQVGASKAVARLIVETAVGTLVARFPGMKLRGNAVFTGDAFFRK